MTKPRKSTVFRFVILIGVVNLFADLTYEGARSITGPFLAQLGAALAAFGAGAIRTVAGDYRFAFWIAGALCVVTGMSFLTIGWRSFVSGDSVQQLAAASAT